MLAKLASQAYTLVMYINSARERAARLLITQLTPKLPEGMTLSEAATRSADQLRVALAIERGQNYRPLRRTVSYPQTHSL